MLSLHGHNHLHNVYVEFCHRAHLPGVRVESGSTIMYTRPKPYPARGCTCPRLGERIHPLARRLKSGVLPRWTWWQNADGCTTMVVQFYNGRRVSVNYVIAGVNSKDSVQMSCKLLAGI